MLLTRIAASAAAVTAWLVVNFFANTASTLALGKVAGAQFDPSDDAYVMSSTEMAFWKQLGLSTLVLIVIVLAIWMIPIRRYLKISAAAIALLVTLPFGDRQAFAYYNQQDYAEPYLIMPNESAFWVPDVGDNKDTQNSFDSPSYLNANKIASKRFIVPHTKLSGTGFWNWSNYYVPVGRLYIVDRTPYSREWVSSPNRGTSKRDEGFKCQSSEGLDINVGITISTFVTEENAANFLYHYGVHAPAGERTNPEVIFTSVLYGRSLVEVMDSNVRNAVQALVCQQMMGRTLADDNAQANQIIGAIRTEITKFLGEKGISVDFLGWADTFTFSEKVQDAIDRNFVAQQDKQIAGLLGPLTGTIQQLAVAEALRSKWNGQTPAQVSLTFLPQGLSDFLGTLFKPFVRSATVPASDAPK